MSKTMQKVIALKASDVTRQAEAEEGLDSYGAKWTTSSTLLRII